MELMRGVFTITVARSWYARGRVVIKKKTVVRDKCNG